MTRTHALALTTFATALVGSSSVASADIVSPPPDDCAPGARGHLDHAGGWCGPTTCTADADCLDLARFAASWGGVAHGYTCTAVDLCVRTESYRPSGRGASRRDPAAPPPTRQVATSCTPSCEAPGTCTHDRRCVRGGVVAQLPPPPARVPAAPAPAAPAPATRPPAAPPPPRGGLCAVSARGAAGPALVAVFAVALFALRRKRRSTG